MIDDQKIKRINELAKKKKEEGLTEEEHAERQALHREYIDAIKGNLRGHLENITIVDAMKPEEEWTEEEKEHAAKLSEQLKAEFDAQNQRDQQVRDTIEGNPRKPEGESGRKMLERMNQSHAPLTQWAFDEAHLPETENNILDIGFGGGAALKKLSKRFPEATLYGIDYSETCVESALDYLREEVIEGKVRLHQGSVSELPYGDNFFNLVISIESYFFWPNFKGDVQGIVRVLAPQGKLLIAAEMYAHEEQTDFDQKIIDKFSLKLKSPQEFKDDFEQAGLMNVQVKVDEEKGWIVAVGEKA